MPLAAGDLIQGKYRVERALRAGGMGSVYVAREEPSGEARVLKLLRVEAANLLEAFRGEFALLSRITHPHLVRVFDFGSEKLRGTLVHFYVAELVDGETLAEHAERGPTSVQALLKPILDALEGLAVLHDAGIRHGDFTPANVLVDRKGRGTLIDLGCAQPFGTPDMVAGSDGFIAPELLTGESAAAAADLFSLGRTLERAFVLAKLRPPAEVARLIQRLLREDASERPASVHEVLEILQRRPVARSYCGPAQLIGRHAELESFEAWLRSVMAKDGAPAICAVHGRAGSGVTRLVQELTWRAQLKLPVLHANPSDSQAVGRLLGRALSVSDPVRSLRGVLSSVALLAEREAPSLLVIEDHHRLDTEQRELLLALLRSLPRRSGLAVLTSGQRLPDDVESHDLLCRPLLLEELRQWASPLVAERKLPSLLSASEGLPAKIDAMLRDLALSGKQANVAEPGAEDARARAQLLALPATGREALALLVARGGEQNGDGEPLARPALADLIAAGVAQREGDRYRVVPAIARAIQASGLLENELANGHRVLATQLSTDSARHSARDVARLIRHWSLAGEFATAEALFLAQAEALRSSATTVWQQLLPLFDRGNAALLLKGAHVMLAANQNRRAVALAIRAARHRPEAYEEGVLIVTDGLIRLGRPARAERIVRRAIALAEPAVSSKLLDRMARAKLACGDYGAARPLAERALGQASSAEERARAYEALGIALSYVSDLAGAQRALEQALATWGSDAAPRDVYRTQSASAIAAFRAGDVVAALALGGEALARAEENNLDDLVPTALLNLGTAEQQCGLWGSALKHYEQGLSFARAIGKLDTELTLLFNLANLFAAIGAFEHAEELLLRLEAQVSQQRLAHLLSAIGQLRAEILVVQGQLEAAERTLKVTERELASSGQTRETLEVALRSAELDLEKGEVAAAERKLEQLLPALTGHAEDLKVVLQLLEARILRARGDASAVRKLEELQSRARVSGMLAFEALVATELATACESLASVEDAAAHSERARRLWDRVAVDLPSNLGALYWRHPRRARLAERSRVLRPAEVAGETVVLRRLLSLVRRLNSPHSLESVLTFTTNAAVELTSAERGFLMLTEEGSAADSLSVHFGTEPVTLGQGPSQSIALRAFTREEAVLAADAQADPRFLGNGSVHALQLKSVLCVPILAPSGTLGVIYVDCRLQRNRFTAADRELLAAFADHVAVAIGNARRVRMLEQRSAELEQQRRALERASEGQERELQLLKQVVLAQRQSVELRHDYSQIIGRGPAMRRLLASLDKLTDSDVNVLILGDSGTGKELVARTLHGNGPRRAGPFLGINCAALPEALLESELFGHVRGAFTGADREKLGLLQAASGGTLFLDEIGELPLATQAKLLRVLQEREVRPLGATRAVPLDIRLLAATHRDLTREIAVGSFREDLYYRIAVVSVNVPPLRDRIEDLPALTMRILERLAKEAGRKRPELAPDALRKLSGHPFRGNVRELENVLTRAFVLASGTRITAQDIDLGKPEPRARIDSRQGYEEQERATILEALLVHRWNVTAVAGALGMPRVTLHRKLRRYGIVRSRSSVRN